MTLRLAALLTLVLVLGGCVHTPPPPPADLPWSVEAMAAADRFVVKGKVGFRRGETGGNAALTWQQDGERYRLAASGPLGQGATRITGNSQRIRIEDGKGMHESDAPEVLLAEALGWPVSINSLSYWVRGLAAPGSTAEVQNDDAGRPARIRQQDWDIVLDRWRADDGRVLPHRVVATGGDSRVTLLIGRWDFADDTARR